MNNINNVLENDLNSNNFIEEAPQNNNDPNAQVNNIPNTNQEQLFILITHNNHDNNAHPDLNEEDEAFALGILNILMNAPHP